MFDIAKLKAERAESARAARNVMDNNVNSWTKENQAEYDTHLTKIENISSMISNHERMLAVEAENKFANPSNEQIRDEFGRPTKQKSHMKAYMQGGMMNLPEDVRKLQISNAQTVGTTTEGGYAVATPYLLEVIKSMKAYSGIRELARELNTDTGASIPLLTNNATAEKGELLTESTTAATADTVFGTIDLATYKFSSKSIPVSIELLQDAYIDIEAYIAEILATRLGRITADYFATGTGSSQPMGLVTASTNGATGATGAATSVTYAKLVDLQHSVNRSYRSLPGVGFMMNDASIAIIRKIVDGNSRPIFVPGYEVANNLAAPDTLLGAPLYTCDEIAVMAANAKSILYGAFSKYFVRNVMQMQLFRMADSVYVTKGQIGFLAMMRNGGTLSDVAAVKHYANAAS